MIEGFIQDQMDFMLAGDQTCLMYNEPQEEMYLGLIEEEVQELEDASEVVEELDALIDIMVVCIGTILSNIPREIDWSMNVADSSYEEVVDMIINGEQTPELLIKRCVLAVELLGVDVQEAWAEVMNTNFAKINPNTGKVNKREDGKIIKPEGWVPPNLQRFFD